MNYDENMITPEEYKLAYGEDLNLVCPELDDPSNRAKRFINIVQLYLNTYLKKNYEYMPITDNNKNVYKKGLMRMIYVVLNKTGLDNFELDNIAYMILRSGGFCNAKKWSGEKWQEI